MVKLRTYRVRASSIIESITSLVLIVTVFLIAGMVISSVSYSFSAKSKLRSRANLLHLMASYNLNDRDSVIASTVNNYIFEAKNYKNQKSLQRIILYSMNSDGLITDSIFFIKVIYNEPDTIGND
jgi:hypothetical protein